MKLPKLHSPNLQFALDKRTLVRPTSLSPIISTSSCHGRSSRTISASGERIILISSSFKISDLKRINLVRLNRLERLDFLRNSAVHHSDQNRQ